MTLRPDGRSVLIAVDRVSNPGPLTNFLVGGEWLYNLDNIVFTEITEANGVVLNGALSHQNIGWAGDPLYAGSAFNGTNANVIEVLAGGSDIGGSGDHMHLVSKTVTGDFVAHVRVTRLDLTDPSAKAGLMARAGANTNSPHLGLFTTPAAEEGGAGVWQTLARFNTNGDTTTLATRNEASFPNNWLKLRRTNDTFYTYYSSNGVNWVALATNTPSPAFPSTMLVGLATTARTNAAGVFTKANYAGFTVTGTPPRIVSHGRLPEGTYRLTFTGPVGSGYSARASTNAALAPVTSWPVISTGTCQAGPNVVEDLQATNHPWRFYLITLP